MSEILMRLDDLDPITLKELDDTASFLERTDSKYLVASDVVPTILSRVSPTTRVLEIENARAFRYESTYFDTPDLRTYLDAAHSRPIRFKVRTRTYRNSNLCMLEVKVRDRNGFTHKSRMPYEAADRLDQSGRDFVAEFELIAPVADHLRPTLRTTFTRRTLALPDSSGRVTIDTDIECSLPHGDRLVIPNLAIIETKSAGIATVIDKQLWSHHYRPTNISKFGTGLAALRPQLPSNKWHRTLRIIDESRRQH
jgi:hypothetical protein